MFVKENTVNFDIYKYSSAHFLCLVAISVIKLMIGILTQNYMQLYVKLCALHIPNASVFVIFVSPFAFTQHNTIWGVHSRSSEILVVMY